MDNIYAYIVRLLQQYASLLKFKPKRTPGAREITQGTLLGDFDTSSHDQVRRGFPHYKKPPRMAGCCHRKPNLPYAHRFESLADIEGIPGVQYPGNLKHIMDFMEDNNRKTKGVNGAK